MKTLLQIVEERLESRGSNLNWLSQQLQVTRSGLFRALQNETLPAKQLRALCVILELSSDELLGLGASDDNILYRIEAGIELIAKKLHYQP